jgi:hypothetical protein
MRLNRRYLIEIISIMTYYGTMQKVVRIFHSFREADEAERDAYMHLTPEERLSIVEQLRRENDKDYDGDQQRLQRVARVFQRSQR